MIATVKNLRRVWKTITGFQWVIYRNFSSSLYLFPNQ